MFSSLYRSLQDTDAACLTKSGVFKCCGSRGRFNRNKEKEITRFGEHVI